jgi:hypothetical protein
VTESARFCSICQTAISPLYWEAHVNQHEANGESVSQPLDLWSIRWAVWAIFVIVAIFAGVVVSLIL